jgi:DNA-binding CsgD family transcriptional regulator
VVGRDVDLGRQLRACAAERGGLQRGDRLVGDGGTRLQVRRSLDRRPLGVIVVPTPANVRALYGHGGAVSLFLTDPERRVRLDARGLRADYGLTAAETRVAELLVQGADVAGIGRRLGVSIHTVRSQVKRVLEKTATSRQSELVALLMRSAAFHHGEPPPKASASGE